MKKLFFFSLLTIILVGCGTINPPEPPEPPVVKKFTITGIPIPVEGGSISPISQTVDKGGTAAFAITPGVGYITSHLKDGNTVLPATDLYTVRDISENDTFNVVFKKDSILFPLLRVKWVEKESYSFMDGCWYQWEINNPMSFSFSSDGTYTENWKGSTSKEKWTLDRNAKPMILTIGGFEYPFLVESINENKLVIYYNDPHYEMIVRFVFGNDGYK